MLRRVLPLPFLISSKVPNPLPVDSPVPSPSLICNTIVGILVRCSSATSPSPFVNPTGRICCQLVACCRYSIFHMVLLRFYHTFTYINRPCEAQSPFMMFGFCLVHYLPLFVGAMKWAEVHALYSIQVGLSTLPSPALKPSYIIRIRSNVSSTHLISHADQPGVMVAALGHLDFHP